MIRQPGRIRHAHGRKETEMNCPHCHKPIDPTAIRKAANADAARKKRPGARGLIRNPAGRPAKQNPLKLPVLD